MQPTELSAQTSERKFYPGLHVRTICRDARAMTTAKTVYKCSVCGVLGHTAASSGFHSAEERETARKERDVRIAALKKQHRATKQHQHVGKSNPLPTSAVKLVKVAAAYRFAAAAASANSLEQDADDTQADEAAEAEGAPGGVLEQLQLRVKELEKEVAILKACRKKCKAQHRLTGNEKKRRKSLALKKSAAIDLP